jgi:hypothetical protein
MRKETKRQKNAPPGWISRRGAPPSGGNQENIEKRELLKKANKRLGDT